MEVKISVGIYLDWRILDEILWSFISACLLSHSVPKLWSPSLYWLAEHWFCLGGLSSSGYGKVNMDFYQHIREIIGEPGICLSFLPYLHLAL